MLPRRVTRIGRRSGSHVHSLVVSFGAEQPEMLARLSILPPLPPDVYLRPAHRPLPFPLDRPGARIWQRGRHALWQGLRALGLRAGDEVLVPAYHHGSEIEAYVRAGLVPRYYDPGPGLLPDPGALDLPTGGRVRAFHLIHYLGRPTPAAEWRAWCQAHGLRLIEDAAQGWLGRDPAGAPLGSTGDAAIFSLYKAVAVPDGGALALREAPAPSRPLAGGVGLRGLARRHLAWAAMHLPPGAALATPRRGAGYDPMADFDLGDPWSGATDLVRPLLPRLATPEIQSVRLRNYRMLAAALGRWVPDGFREVVDGASPFALPVHTADKAGVCSRLVAAGIDAVDTWRASHPSLEEARYPTVRDWRCQTLLLPVHQELRASDLERIAEAAADALRWADAGRRAGRGNVVRDVPGTTPFPDRAELPR
jgi:hypothetical protein